MSYDLESIGQEFMEPINITDMSEISQDSLIESLKTECKNNSIPATFCKETFINGKGFFGKMSADEFPAVLVTHPDPPQKYCSQLYIIFNDGIRGVFVGESTAFRDKAESDYNLQSGGDTTGFSLKGKLKAAVGMGYNKEAYDNEIAWHGDVLNAFRSLFDFS